jgi:hypothetical protein
MAAVDTQEFEPRARAISDARWVVDPRRSLEIDHSLAARQPFSPVPTSRIPDPWDPA